MGAAFLVVLSYDKPRPHSCTVYLAYIVSIVASPDEAVD